MIVAETLRRKTKMTADHQDQRQQQRHCTSRTESRIDTERS